MKNDIRIKDCIDNHEKYVSYLTTLSDKKLAEKLDTAHLQSALAVEKKNTASVELLEIWRKQIIEARILKAENNIPDAPDEIELAIADIEKVVLKTEQRQEILNVYTNPEKQPQLELKTQQDNDTQLSLF